jgi:hypothetical protein
MEPFRSTCGTRGGRHQARHRALDQASHIGVVQCTPEYPVRVPAVLGDRPPAVIAVYAALQSGQVRESNDPKARDQMNADELLVPLERRASHAAFGAGEPLLKVRADRLTIGRQR